MLPFLKFNEVEILAFALVLLRVSAFTVSWPVFSVYNVPNISKILFAVLLSMVMFPIIDRTGLTAQGLGNEVVWLAGREVLTGLCLGFLTRLFFFAVSAGANLIATSAGLANAQLFNPTMGASTTTVEQFYAVIATLLFLAANGHHMFLTGLAESFQAIPLGPAGIDIAVFKESGELIQAVVEAGIKMSAPVLVAIFVMNVAMGIIGRAVPQINVLVTSMPVNFMTGIVVMLISIPALVLQLDHDIVEFADMMFRFMRAM
ncbi:MAG: flagellar biosynthetic protein FliR [Bdellovibrionota bacterium]